ncbi:MAG: hypothetical protein VZR53_05645 [Prevotella sp.]|nr:hypothetical protein [Prevotella sp.]
MALPYKVKVCLYERETCILLGIDGCDMYLDVDSDPFRIESIKPYLRPMSSMTEEEKKEFDNFCVIDEFVWEGKTEIGYKNQAIIMSVAINWLLKKHFDFMDLIPKGLAIEVTEENYG